MKKYRTRPGVVLTSICGEQLLVSAKANLNICPYVSQINDSSAFLWSVLAHGATEDELIRAVKDKFEVEEPEDLRPVIEAFLETMLEKNYLLVSEQGGKDEE